MDKSYLNQLPEDIARMVWRNVFNGVIADINDNKATLRFYFKKRDEAIKRQEDILKKADSLRKRFNKCKKKEEAKAKMLAYNNEYVDFQLLIFKNDLYIASCLPDIQNKESDKYLMTYLEVDRETQMKELTPKYRFNI